MRIHRDRFDEAGLELGFLWLLVHLIAPWATLRKGKSVFYLIRNFTNLLALDPTNIVTICQRHRNMRENIAVWRP
jgi:hypothetical protein